MKRLPTSRARFALLLAVASPLLASCVERLLVVRSEPAGALVYIDGNEAGVTPLSHRFDFYGTVDVEVRKYDIENGYRRGYRAVHIEKELTVPWHQHFPLDFITEFLIPWPIRDVHSLDVQLKPYPGELSGDTWDDLKRAADEQVATMRRKLVDESTQPE